MKVSLLTSFVAIALSAVSAFSNTIPSGKSVIAPVFKRQLTNSLQTSQNTVTDTLEIDIPNTLSKGAVAQFSRRGDDGNSGNDNNNDKNGRGGANNGAGGNNANNNNGRGDGNNNGPGNKDRKGSNNGNDNDGSKGNTNDGVGGYINGNNDNDFNFDAINPNSILDLRFLNLALLLEDFLVSFFERGLSRYSQADFTKAGYPDWVRGRYEQICEHDKKQREYIKSAITSAGGNYIRSCRYEFSDDNVRDFIETSEALKTIALSAYTGSLQYFHDRNYITASATILAVEARHAAWINGAVRKQNPWNREFETPLTPNEVATLLTTFFDFNSCPTGNANNLPNGLRVYPRLHLSNRLVPGQQAEISFHREKANDNERLYAAFLTGIETIFVPIEELRDNNDDGRHYFVEIPHDLQATGTVFVIVVRGSENIRDVNLNDDSVVAGPAIAEFPFDSNGKPINW